MDTKDRDLRELAELAALDEGTEIEVASQDGRAAVRVVLKPGHLRCVAEMRDLVRPVELVNFAGRGR